MRRYLIVDDNRPFAENLAEILRDQDDQVDVVTSGEEAIALVRQQRYHALVSDMRMPVMTGAEVVHRIRRIDPGLPAIVITAYPGEDDLRNARREGLLAVLPKPVPIGLLLSLLAIARRDGLVALIEDDVALSDNLTEALRSRGFSAVTASSVLETERLGAVRPIAGLVDLRVPEGPDGEAARKLAAKYPSIPLYVITGHDEATAATLDYRKLFRKPFETASLLREIEGLSAPS